MTRTKAAASGPDVAETEAEVNKWRALGTSYRMYYSNDLKDARAKTSKKRTRLEANLLRVEHLLDAPGPNPEKELATWRAVGKAVIAHIDKNPPGWCDRGRQQADIARRLLGMPILREVRMIVLVDEKILDEYKSYPEKIRVTITTHRGKSVAENCVVKGLNLWA